jgi:hypothetical protein
MAVPMQPVPPVTTTREGGGEAHSEKLWIERSRVRRNSSSATPWLTRFRSISWVTAREADMGESLRTWFANRWTRRICEHYPAANLKNVNHS